METDSVEPSILTESNENIPSTQNIQTNKTTQSKNDIPPNNTLYINNIHEKIKIEDLKHTLLTLFSTFGEIVEVHAKKKLSLRGQAFIVFKDLSSAIKAKEAIVNYALMGKLIVLLF